MGRTIRSSRAKLRFSHDRVLGWLTLFCPLTGFTCTLWTKAEDEYKSMSKVKPKVNKVTLPEGGFESRHV